VPTEPSEVAEALRGVLGSTAEVALETIGDEPFAVVKVPPEPECWVNLAVSIAAFPSASAETIAHTIAEAEGWA
jgi:hypothetical protein